MAFAKRKTGGGESFPLVKWDGRVGRLYTQDREQDERGEWHSVQNDVTDGFVAAFNLRGTEHGYEVPERGGTGDGHGPDGRRHR
jgi:hypothetical protein